VTPERYAELAHAQHGRCAACDRHEDSGLFALPGGLLCRRCLQAAGLLAYSETSAQRLTAVIANNPRRATP
jgi:hypothetical protein